MELHDNGSEYNFIWIDYLLFCLILVICAVIGLYFSTYGKKENSTREYLHGGKRMGILPVSVSLIATTISGVTFLGNPSEVYMYGTLYWLASFSAIFAGIINAIFFLPVFYELQLNSSYEYLELRFNRSVRVMCSFLFTIFAILFVPIVVYGPALAASQVSGVNLHYITPVITLVCVIYTMLGGIKAVIWTDFLQGVVVIAASLTVAIFGVQHIGGLATVWQRSMKGGRIRIFEMNPSPFERMTFWNVIIGYIFLFLGLLTNQAMIQRFMSVSTLSKARSTGYYYACGITVIYTITCFIGLVIYAEYYNCDPITTKVISKPDELMTYYITNVISNVPGISGLFFGGVMCAALSTMSSYFNSVGATLFEDFVRPCFKNSISEHKSNALIKVIVVIIGVITIAMTLVVEKLGLLVQLTTCVGGVTGGATLGVYAFGMFYPRGNAKGALAGGIASLVIMGWIVSMAQKYTKYPSLPRSAEACGYNQTMPHGTKLNNAEDEVFILYKISFAYYTLIGLIIVFIVGITVSHMTEPPKSEQCIPILFTPLIRKYVRNRNKSYDQCKQMENEF